MSDLAVAKFLRLGRGGQESIDLPINEKIHRIVGSSDPMDILVRIKADEFCHEAHEVPGRRIAWNQPTVLPFRSVMLRT